MEQNYCYVVMLAYTHAVTWTNIRLFSRLTIQPYVWPYDRLICHTRIVICMFIRTADCTCIQSSSRLIGILTFQIAIRSFGRPNHRTAEHFILFRPIVVCGFETAAKGIVPKEPNGRIGRYLCRRNDSDVDGSRLVCFYGGGFNSSSDEQQNVFANGK